MSTPSPDLHILAERISEAVNRKLAAIMQRVEEQSSRINRLELEVMTLRQSTIESVVRSVLSVKMEELAALIAAKTVDTLAARIEEQSAKLGEAITTISTAAETLRGLTNLPTLISNEIQKQLRTMPQQQIDLEPLARRINELDQRLTETQRDLGSAIASLSERLNELEKALKETTSMLAGVAPTTQSIESLRKKINSIEKSVKYIEEVIKAIEERMKEVEIQ